MVLAVRFLWSDWSVLFKWLRRHRLHRNWSLVRMPLMQYSTQKFVLLKKTHFGFNVNSKFCGISTFIPYAITDNWFFLFFFVFLQSVDLQGINIFASNKSNVASVNVTVSPSAAQLNLAGIFHGYIIFYKEIDEVNYQSQRVISAEMSFLIPGLKHWTLYDIYARLVTLNGVGKRSNELVVWTRPVGKDINYEC